MLLRKSVLAAVAVATLTVSAAFATVPAQTNSCNYQFNTNLRLGAVSQDVQNLQKLLNMDAATKVAMSGAGSMGSETFRFGPATMAAVKKFQAANGISPVSGYVGPLTRGVLNTICSTVANNNNNTNTNTGSGVVSNNIPVSVLVAGQANAKLAEFVVSGNGTVTGVELMRTGLSNNSTLKNVYLYDGATRLTGASSVLTDGTIRFTSSSGLFPVSGSKTITVRADLLTGTSGQTVGVAMKSVTMMGGTATPVVGANGPLFSISSATLAGANLTTTSPSPSASTINAGSMNQTLWSNSVNVSTNASKLHAVTFKMIGSAPANTLANVKLFVDGVERGMATINSWNQYVFNMMGNPVMLTTGSHFIELRGDVVAGANRNFYISLEEATDLLIEDSTLPGVFVTPTYQTGTLVNILGGTVTINNGSLTINQDITFNNTTTLVSGATNVKMGAFKFTSFGEDVKVTSLTVRPVVSSLAPATTTNVCTSGDAIANVGLYVNGGQVGSNQSAYLGAGCTVTFNNLGTNLYVPAGQSVTVEVKGDVVNANGTVNLTAGTIRFDLVAGSSNAQGVSSSQLTSTSGASGQSLTIASSNVTFTQTTGFSASTKAPNQAGVKIGSYTVQTGSSEGITVNQLGVVIGGTMGTQLTNLTVKDGSTIVGTPIGNPITGTNNFNVNVNVPMNTTKVFDVYGDFGSASTGLNVTASSTLSYRGLVSNVTNSSLVTGVAAVITANVASMVAGGVTFNTGLSPVSQLIVGGQSNFNIGTFNFKVNNNVGGATLKDVTFAVATNTINSITMNGKTATVVNGRATILDVGSVIPADAGGVNVPVSVSLVCVGLSNGCSATTSAIAQIGITGLTFNNGSTVDTTLAPGAITANATTSAFYINNSKPTLTVNSTQQTGLVLGAENKVGEVTIAADANGMIRINKISFNSVLTNITGGATSTPRIADGNITISGSSCAAGAFGIECTLGTSPSGYTISAGTSKTFSLYMTVTGSAAASTVPTVSSSVVQNGLSWDDVVGGGTNLNGANIYNYPTNSYSIRQ